MILLVIMMFKPANGTIKIYEYLYNNVSETNNLIISDSRETYHFLVRLKSTFYRPKNVSSIVIDSQEDISNYLIKHNIESAFFIHKQLYFEGKIKNYKVTRVYSDYPNWIKHLHFVDWQKAVRTKTVYKITKNTN